MSSHVVDVEQLISNQIKNKIKNQTQPIFESFFDWRLNDWRLFCALAFVHIVIGIVIGGIIVELFIHKSPTRTQQSTPSIMSTTPITTQPTAVLTKGGIIVLINL